MSARRDALLFLLAALIPSLALGFLGVRAAANEQAALEREARLRVEGEAARLAARARVEVEEATTRLADVRRAAASDEELYARALGAAPDFAVAFLASPELRVVFPRAPGDARRQDPACDDAARALAGGDRSAATRVVARCEELRDGSQRWLWPVLVLDALGTQRDPALAARVCPWFTAHASELGREERLATLEELQRVAGLEGEERACVQGALERRALERGDREELVASAARSAELVRAERTALTRPGEAVSFSGPGRYGAVLATDAGALLGFVTSRETVRAAVVAPDGSLRSGDAALELAVVGEPPRGDEGVVAFAALSDGLGLLVTLRDPGEIERKSRAARRLLYGLSATGVALGLGLAWLLYRRMQQTRRTSELRTSFVAGVSHELRTPLASVRMLAELFAEDRLDDAEERAEVAQALAKEAQRMSATVDRFMAYARSERGKLSVSRSRVDLAALVARRAEAFRARHPGMELLAPQHTGPCVAAIDPPQIEIALDNLLENAAKYAPDGQPFTIELRRTNSACTLAVADRGPGLPRGRERAIFDAFERGDDRLSRATEGTGLGLFLVRAIARAHGGDAYAERREGGGARFVVSLPREQGEEAGGWSE